MENRIKNTKIKRLLAFIFDFVFILLLAFAADMLFGLIYPLDSMGYQTFMVYPLLIIMVPYLFFGELLFTNTLGKVVFGLEIIDFEQLDRPSVQSLVKRGLLKILFPVEGLALLFSRSKRRLGDLWAGTIVANKISSRIKPYTRIVLGVVALAVSYFSFAISLGLAVKQTEIYQAGTDYLKCSGQFKVTGLPKEVSLSGNKANFGLPVSGENPYKYAIVYLDNKDGEWQVDSTRFFKGHLGVSFSLSP